MSGICGIYSPRQPDMVSSVILNHMLETIAHRGSSARQTFVDEKNGVAVGHVFAPAFRPPNSVAVPNWYDDDEYLAALDGVIFNHADFSSSVNYSNRCIGTVIEHLRQSPHHFPEKLDGNFGLAVWQKQPRTLWLVRDALGAKPLYYFHLADKGLIVFASELKAILAHPSAHRRLNREALSAYLSFGYVPAPLSMFDGMCKVFSGEALKIDDRGRLTQRQFWNMPPCKPQREEMQTIAAQLREQVIQSIARHVAETPRVGLLLSGGVDSTIIMAALSLLGIPERHAFTIKMDSDRRSSEADSDYYWSARVARMFSATHHPIPIQQNEQPLALLASLTHLLDEPLLVSSRAVCNHILTQVAKSRGVDSCLGGNGSEYLFGLNSWKRILRWREAEGGADERIDEEKLALLTLDAIFSFEDQKKLLCEPIDQPEIARNIVRRYREGIQTDDLYDVIAGVQLRMEGAEKAIWFYDRTALANGVEIRHPFHDTQLLRFANTIPPVLKGSASPSMKRAALIQAFQDVLPEGIVTREKRAYPPHPGFYDMLNSTQLHAFFFESLKHAGIFNPKYAEKLLKKYNEDRKHLVKQKIMSLFFFQLWFEVFVNQNHNLENVLHDCTLR